MKFQWNMTEQEWKNYVSDCEILKRGENDGFSQSYIDGLHGECVVGLLHAHIVVDSRPEQFSEIYIDESEDRDSDEDLKWLDWGPVPDETADSFESFKKKFEEDFEKYIENNALGGYTEWLPSNFRKDFSKRLKEIRKSKNLTQSEFAEKVGLARATISYYEQEGTERSRLPDVEILYRMCRATGISADYFMGLAKNPKTKMQTCNLSEHYRNCLAVQFGMEIAGNQPLTTAWDVEQENLDVLFNEWTNQFLSSDFDDSFEFFQEKINAWASAQVGKHPIANLSEGSIKPGDTVYAIALEKKLNASGRWQSTRNPAVMRLIVTSVYFEPSDDGATLQAFIDGFREDNSNYQRISADDCYLSENVAEKALEMWGAAR